MPSRFSNDFFKNLYNKAKDWMGFGKKPDEEIDPIQQDPEEIVQDDEYVLDPTEPINVPFDQEPPFEQDYRRINDPQNVELRIQDMVQTPVDERDLPPIDGKEPEDATETIIERKPEESEQEFPDFPEGKAGFQLKIEYAMDHGLVLAVDYIGPYQRFGPDYEIRPLEWGLGQRGRFAWVKDVNDLGVAVKIFYLEGFRSVEFRRYG